jgi:hypothetical protein
MIWSALPVVSPVAERVRRFVVVRRLFATWRVAVGIAVQIPSRLLVLSQKKLVLF